MKHIKLFEGFEIVEPIKNGDTLSQREIAYLGDKGVLCPEEFILKDDGYYYIGKYRCENIKDVPETYIRGLCNRFEINNFKIN